MSSVIRYGILDGFSMLCKGIVVNNKIKALLCFEHRPYHGDDGLQ